MPARRQPPPGASLFDEADLLPPDAPLAARMRPRTLDEYTGQAHLLGPGQPLRRAIEADAVPSLILWGPPGTGKTTLARIIARRTRAAFAPVSAVSSGVADLRQIVAEATRRRAHGQRTILFIDEIHRFNKAQQDAVLPAVEDGTVTLIGATTENPSFEVIGPLLSRARVYVLKPLEEPHLRTILARALQDPERGLGRTPVAIEDAAIRALIALADGDARTALNVLEMCALTAQATGEPVTPTLVEEVIQRRLHYDKAGDAHYNTISAFIKSLRGSDPDAALYWLARMIEAGEDPLFIVRRLVILAAEDVGLADPQALSMAMAAQQAVHFVGLPEGYLPLAEATLYLALAPKSNSALTAYQRALADVRQHGDLPVPLPLRNAPTRLMRDLDYGKGYRYAHDEPEHMAPGQTHLPDALAGRRYYEADALGHEAGLARAHAERRRQARAARPAGDRPPPDPADA